MIITRLIKYLNGLRALGPLIFCLGPLVVLPARGATAPGAGSVLTIQSIHIEGKFAVVTINVIPGMRRVSLESRARFGVGTWEPRAVTRIDQAAASTTQTITFRIPLSANIELLRVRGDSTEALPASFYSGTNSFSTSAGSAPPAPAAGVGAGGAADVTAAPGAPQANAPEDKSRAVVESDIWNISGDTLYFFNQYRGLQVIDISKPDAPSIRGTFALPAAGEQMYLVDANHVVLLVHGLCGATTESHVTLLEIVNGQPKPAAELPVSGQIRESRLVGTALYVVADQYRQIKQSADPKGGVSAIWEWGSQVFSFDLGQFSNATLKSTAWIPGYGNAIQATDKFLFVASPQIQSNWWTSKSDIHVFDISAPDGTMVPLSTIHTAGRVLDKFKMNLNRDVFTTVSATFDSNKTVVETFSLADPKNPKALGSLFVVDREQLYATRFDGDRLYVVTYFRVDPLWVIDLRDPASPKKVGQLNIPGWSTFIQPLDGRLVTIGIDNTNGWRVAVQLFDVHDPTKPALLSKVALGEQYSSSEANFDEKAFGVLPDQNLILVPYTTYGKDGQFQGVQLIDMDQSGLRKRGTIEHQMQARRATVHRDRIVSISGVELLTVDMTDRDRPHVTSDTELSWPADRVFVAGDHLIEVAAPWNGDVSLHVVRSGDPAQILKTARLGKAGFLGATVRDQRLYVAQGKSTEVIWPLVASPTKNVPEATNQATLAVSIFDLTKLPELPLLGRSETKSDITRYWGRLNPLWPKPGLLVWNSAGYGFSPWLLGVSDAVGAPMAGTGGAATGAATAVSAAPLVSGGGGAAGIAVRPIPWWGGDGTTLLAFDVSDAATPKFVSEVNLRGSNYWWNFGKAMATDGLIYTSHQSSEFAPDLQPPPQVEKRWDGKQYTTFINTPPPGMWVQRYFLDVINYADPKSPSVRKPVNIPGALIGVAQQGELLFTQGYRYRDVVRSSDWFEWLDASAYDGVEAHAIDSLPLPANWPHPVLAQNDYALVGRAPEGKDPNSTIETWRLSSTGKFGRVGAKSLDSPAQNFVAFGSLLAVQQTGQIQLFNSSDPANLKFLARGAGESCIGYDLQQGDGTVERGLWIPLGAYGVSRIPIPTSVP